MRDTIRKILDLLDGRGRRRALLVLAMIVVMAVLETVGVASVVPFVAVLGNPGLVESNRYLKLAYDGLGFTNTHDFFLFLGAAVFLVTVGSTAFKALTAWAILRFTGRRNHALACRLFQGYINQPYAWFLRRHSSDLGKTVLSEVNEVIGGVLLPSMQLIAHALVAILMISMLVIADPVLAAVVSVVLGGVYGLIHWASRRYVTRIGKERVEANRERYRLSSEAFGGIKDVKVLGLEETFLRRFEKPSLRYVERQANAKMIQQLPQYALQAIAFGGILLIVQYQLLVHDGLGQALPLIALYALAGYRLMPALQQVYQKISTLRYAKPALDSLHSDLIENEPPSRASNSVPTEDAAPMKLRERLELHRVSYGYPGAAALALDHVTMSIPARSTVGLVGETGSGKTTAVDVILGLLEPSEGRLSVDGTPITAANQRIWRRCVGYVPQQIFLSDDTVAANIAFGVAPASVDMTAVERAARIANLHGFVTADLEHGYKTLVGERGVRLSGGQRQRIGIARALYHDPEVLVMDEATSALDNITERAVMEAVVSLERQKTIILVAHRLTTVRRCDKIFLLERGRVAASGAYDELAECSEKFQSMLRAL